MVIVIPYQVETGCPVCNQFVLSVQPGPFVLLYKATNARESASGTCPFTKEAERQITIVVRTVFFIVLLFRGEVLLFAN
ncbi:hypothetical protein ES708_20035 [subsurface metagenome]